MVGIRLSLGSVTRMSIQSFGIIPAVRHSDTEPVKKNRASDFYMQIMSKGTITPAPGKYNYAVGLGRQNEILSEI